MGGYKCKCKYKFSSCVGEKTWQIYGGSEPLPLHYNGINLRWFIGQILSVKIINLLE